MKKLLILVVLLSIVAVGLFAETADYFTFSMGSGSGYDMITSDVVVQTAFGVNYTFNKTFSGGFKYIDIAANSGQFMDMTIAPADKMSLSLYTGKLAALSAFGLGVGYDIFTKKDGLFSKLSINIDWLATDGGAYDIASGGVILFGLRTQFGI